MKKKSLIISVICLLVFILLAIVILGYLGNEDLDKVAITGFILLGLYEAIKWGVATALAPETGGASWAVAGCMP